jgi:hypothetical protein
MTALTADAGSASAWRVLTSRNFGPYFVGNAASASGTWFHNLAASILIYRLTHSPFLLGVLNFSQFVPVLALAPWAGRFADTYDRRRILLVTQPTAAFVSGTLALVAWTGHTNQWIVIAFSCCLGSLNAFANAAQMSLVGLLVPAEDLPQAVALNAMTFNLARAVGPVSAAAVIAGFGTAPAFAINSVSFLIFAGGLLSVRSGEQVRPNRTSLRESLGILRTHPRLLGYLAVTITVSFATDPINTEGPAFAHRFGLSSTWAGAIVGAFGVGAVLAGATIAGRRASGGRTAVTIALMASGIVGLGLASWFPVALAFAALAGFGYLSANAAATTKLQLGVEEWQRGRIMALWSVAFLGTRPFASMIDGALSGAIGVGAAAVAMGALAFVTAGLIFGRSRGVRAG